MTFPSATIGPDDTLPSIGTSQASSPVRASTATRCASPLLTWKILSSYIAIFRMRVFPDSTLSRRYSQIRSPLVALTA